MYKTFTAEDFSKKLALSANYRVSGFLVYGSFKEYPYKALKESLQRLGHNATFRQFSNEFLKPVLEFKVGDKNFGIIAN